MQIVPLEKPYAGEIGGIDLSRLPGTEVVQEILSAWADFPVLVFRDQDLDVEAHQAIANCFGQLTKRARPGADKGKDGRDLSQVKFVTNLRDENGEPLGSEGDANPLAFHSDGCFNKVPTLASLLYGIEVPRTGGETLFSNMYAVYGALSPATRNAIQGRDGINYYYFGYRHYNRNGGPAGAGGKTMAEAVRHAVHPMVIAHPLTGRPALYACRKNTREIVGMTRSETLPILREIFATVERPEFVYAHKWRKGDLVVYDNRAVQHSRAAFSSEERRMLRRFATVCETPPVAYVAPHRQETGEAPETVTALSGIAPEISGA